MAGRCPASKPLGVARLPRHRLAIVRRATPRCCAIRAAPSGGCLWDLALADVSVLDRYECLASRLYAEIAQPVLTRSGPRRALLYVARSTAPGLPRPGYLERSSRRPKMPGLPQPT